MSQSQVSWQDLPHTPWQHTCPGLALLSPEHLLASPLLTMSYQLDLPGLPAAPPAPPRSSLHTWPSRI